ncbi:MAG: hypothetical protein LBM67_06330 [Lentimicrobiaceae bacterium]|jgi:hypothetical protein|nr:hypothetical protein [Lentimicrobiaceae bacterium]
MTPAEEQLELFERIVAGLELVYERLVAYKKQKNTELVIMRDDKIIRIKPDDL